jgi:hypothetical protein
LSGEVEFDLREDEGGGQGSVSHQNEVTDKGGGGAEQEREGFDQSAASSHARARAHTEEDESTDLGALFRAPPPAAALATAPARINGRDSGMGRRGLNGAQRQRVANMRCRWR